MGQVFKTNQSNMHQLHGMMSRVIYRCEQVWPSGWLRIRLVGGLNNMGSVPCFWLSFLFKSCGLWTLPCDIALRQYLMKP